jgi:hypothetical protein
MSLVARGLGLDTAPIVTWGLGIGPSTIEVPISPRQPHGGTIHHQRRRRRPVFPPVEPDELPLPVPEIPEIPEIPYPRPWHDPRPNIPRGRPKRKRRREEELIAAGVLRH